MIKNLAELYIPWDVKHEFSQFNLFSPRDYEDEYALYYAIKFFISCMENGKNRVWRNVYMDDRFDKDKFDYVLLPEFIFSRFWQIKTRLEKIIDGCVEKNIQVFLFTQNIDVIKSFNEIALERQLDFSYSRIGKDQRASKDGCQLFTSFTAERLQELLKQNIEVR